MYRIHSTLAKSPYVARFAVRLRNQLNHIIGLHLGPTPDARRNGEFRVLEQLAPGCRLFIDVGANIGDWTDRCLTLSSGNIQVYEPSRMACQKIRERFPSDRVTVHELALGDQEGEAVFQEEEPCGQTSFVVEGPVPNSGEKVVRISTLDRDFE